MRAKEEGADKEIDFVAAMTHELKTSLTAIIVSAELLADELQPDEEGVYGKLIQSIIRNAHRLNERLSFLSEIPRAQMGDFRFQAESINIRQVIHDITTELYPKIQSRRQSLTLELPDSLPLVRADKQHLEQILLNLIANANKFSPEEGKIKVSVWQDDSGSLVTRVSDTCGGIPDEEQERIFQAHYQINQHEDKGGLGLAITKFLVELQGGKIWLKGKDGPGCSFLFSLPKAGEDS